MAFNQNITDAICLRIADGESLRAICTSDGMPDKATVFRWLEANAGFRDQYARAREMQADTLFDDILTIADDAGADMKSAGKGDGSLVLDAEHVQRSRLRIDARKWMAGKLRPKVYGEKLELEVTNPPNEEAINAAIAAKLAAMASIGQGGTAEPSGGEGTPDQD